MGFCFLSRKGGSLGVIIDSIKTAIGTIFNLTDSTNRPFKELKIFGKTEQKTTTGKNLLRHTLQTITKAGVTFTVNEDGTVTTSGTASAESEAFATYVGGLVLQAGTYILSGAHSADHRIRVGSTSGTLMGHDEGSGYTFNLTEESTLQVALRVNAGKKADGITFRPMIRLASVADATYEPYTGGIPSPNPDYPQALNSVGENVGVMVCGKNLLNTDAFIQGTNSACIVSEDGYTVDAIGGNNKTYAMSHFVLPVNLLRGKTIHIMCDSFVDSANKGIARIQLNITLNDGGSKYAGMGINQTSFSYAMPTNAKTAVLSIYTNNSSTPLESDNVVIVKGLRMCLESGAAWEPYKEIQNLAVSTPNGLPGIPVTSGGNYTDENGKQWICDEVDFARGVYIQRVGQEVFNGADDENWYTSGTDTTDTYRLTTDKIKSKAKGGANSSTAFHGICSAFYPIPAGQTYRRTMGISIIGSGIVYVYLDDYNTGDAVASWMAYLSEHPMSVIYELAVPIETVLSEAELSAYAELHTYEPNTTIFNDAGACMMASYYA